MHTCTETEDKRIRKGSVKVPEQDVFIENRTYSDNDLRGKKGGGFGTRWGAKKKRERRAQKGRKKQKREREREREKEKERERLEGND